MIEEEAENENGDDDDNVGHSERLHEHRLSDHEPVNIEDDYHDHDRASKLSDRLSPDEQARVAAAAVAHINGTSEYISFDSFSIRN